MQKAFIQAAERRLRTTEFQTVMILPLTVREYTEGTGRGSCLQLSSLPVRSTPPCIPSTLKSQLPVSKKRRWAGSGSPLQLCISPGDRPPWPRRQHPAPLLCPPALRAFTSGAGLGAHSWFGRVMGLGRTFIFFFVFLLSPSVSSLGLYCFDA